MGKLKSSLFYMKLSGKWKLFFLLISKLSFDSFFFWFSKITFKLLEVMKLRIDTFFKSISSSIVSFIFKIYGDNISWNLVYKKNKFFWKMKILQSLSSQISSFSKFFSRYDQQLSEYKCYRNLEHFKLFQLW